MLIMPKKAFLNKSVQCPQPVHQGDIPLPLERIVFL
jgi:hypothetical protein